MIFVRPHMAPLANDERALSKLLALDGDVYSAATSRKTVKITLNGHSFFLKVHFGVGWKEIFKNLLQLKIPVTDAGNEWRAIQKLQEIGVPASTVAAYGMLGWNPARRKSFIMTDVLHDVINLDDFCRNAFQGILDKNKVIVKRLLIAKVASIARKLHQNGINHQDFYLVHFLLRYSPRNGFSVSEHDELLVLDLHRARIRRQVPARAVAKDLAGVYFSSLDIVPLTRRDLYRFIRDYGQKRLRDIFPAEGRFWQRIEKRAQRVYKKFHGREYKAAVLKTLEPRSENRYFRN